MLRTRNGSDGMSNVTRLNRKSRRSKQDRKILKRRSKSRTSKDCGRENHGSWRCGTAENLRRAISTVAATIKRRVISFNPARQPCYPARKFHLKSHRHGLGQNRPVAD